jgi:hypothetical protein
MSKIPSRLRAALRSPWLFVAVLGAVLLQLFFLYGPLHNGDTTEYTLTTIAIANHASPDIRLRDIEDGLRQLPNMRYTYQLLIEDMSGPKVAVDLPFLYGRQHQVYSVHFFAFSALAAIPYKLALLAGLPPFSCYYIVNLFCLLLLGLSLRRLSGGNLPALAGVALFLACGGWLYLRWTSPELMSAAALLAGMALFCANAPLRGGLLIGAAALQNPSIGAALAFMPLLRLAMHGRAGQDWRSLAGVALQGRRGCAGLLLGLATAALAPLWNLYQFGYLSAIAHYYTRPDYISLLRLHSLFFDLSQGMILAVPALLALLLLWTWRGRVGGRWLLAGCCALMLVMALPALPVVNWNSGAQGIMRYAFWAAMPLLFALLWQWRERAVWQPAMALVLVLQAYAMRALEDYHYTAFSPLAMSVMKHAPALYNPEPELFGERVQHSDSFIQENQVYTVEFEGHPLKTMYHADTPEAQVKLCGPGGRVAPQQRHTDSTRGWRYIDGPVKCLPAPVAG